MSLTKRIKRGSVGFPHPHRFKRTSNIYSCAIITILTVLSLSVFGVSNVQAALGPVVTGTSINWINTKEWEGTITISALEISDAEIAMLADYNAYTNSGHKHYIDINTTAPKLTFSKMKSLTGDAWSKLDQINTFVFDTKNPTLGQTVVISTRHNGREYVPDSPECVGTYMFNGIDTVPYAGVLEWPNKCMTTPPPNQICSLDLPDGTFTDLGVVPVGSVQTARFRVRMSCSESGGITLFPGISTVTGTGQASLVSSRIVDGTQSSLLPYRVELRGGEEKIDYLEFNIQYEGAGATETNITIIWSPS